MDNLLPLLLLVVGLCAGGAAGFFLARARSGQEAARLGAELAVLTQRAEADRQALTERAEAERTAGAELLRVERESSSARLADAERGFASRLAGLEQAWADRMADAERGSEERLADERSRAEANLRAAAERAAHEVAQEQERTAARLDELKADQQRVQAEFAALSQAALKENSEAFLAQAQERFKRSEDASAAELAKREAAVAALVEPLTKTLGEVKTEMTSSEKARAEAHGALAEQVRHMQTASEQLRVETSSLVTALRKPQVRGRWGEMQLRRVVEAAGMLSHVDFTEQQTVKTDDGATLRPDLVVHLPGEKHVVVDSKVAFGGYLEAMEAKDEATRNARLTAHARHLRDHIDSLGAKAYWEQVQGTPEFVVMFVPAEAFLNAALETDPTLLERAFERNVVMATPATLVALLRTVGYTWRQERLAADAQQVFTVGRELHKRLGTFGKHLENLRNRLNSTVDAFNKMNRSLDSQLVTQARRFADLQGIEEASVATPPPLEVLAVAAEKRDLFEEPEPEAIPPARPGAKVIEAAPAKRRAKIEPAGDDARAERDAVLDDGDLFAYIEQQRATEDAVVEVDENAEDRTA